MRDRYGSIDQLEREGVDALVVTGAEPRCAEFEDEPYWSSLARIIDWAEAEEIPTAWSCLAAHAAVWRRYRIPRRRGEAKRNGVFTLQKATGRPLLEGAPVSPVAPHSRWNDLDAAQLEAVGLEILTYSDEIGVDTFVRRGRATSIFFQGHPEYDAGALGREYVRDVSRYVRGPQPFLPAPPRNYFGLSALQALADLSTRLRKARDPELLAAVAQVVEMQTPLVPWHDWAAHAYRMWLRQFTDRASAEGRGRQTGHS
jgi:homoserine O-succinyltransferase